MQLIVNLERVPLPRQGCWSETTGIIQQTDDQMILWGMMHYKDNEPPSSYFHNKILLLFLTERLWGMQYPAGTPRFKIYSAES